MCADHDLYSYVVSTGNFMSVTQLYSSVTTSTTLGGRPRLVEIQQQMARGF